MTDAVAVSSDGLLMARSNTLDSAGADQVAAIISGFVSLGHGATRCFGFDELNQIIVAMSGGYLFVSAMGEAGCLGVVATPGCDIGNVGYQMSLLVERAGTDADARARRRAQEPGDGPVTEKPAGPAATTSSVPSS